MLIFRYSVYVAAGSQIRPILQVMIHLFFTRSMFPLLSKELMLWFCCFWYKFFCILFSRCRFNEFIQDIEDSNCFSYFFSDHPRFYKYNFSRLLRLRYFEYRTFSHLTSTWPTMQWGVMPVCNRSPHLSLPFMSTNSKNHSLWECMDAK